MYALLVVVLLALFSLISWQVAVSGPLLAVDVALRDAAAGRVEPNGPLATVAQVGADLGSAPVAGGALVLGAAVLAWRRRSLLVLAVAAMATVAVPALVLPLKEAFGRLGPDGLPLGDYAGYYPSGHAATAAVAYGTLAVLLARRAPVAAPAWAVGLSVWTGAGLVLRGYHWLTDVVASWALSGLVLCALVAVAGPAARHRPAVRGGRDARRR